MTYRNQLVSVGEIADRLAIQDLISYSCHLQDTANFHLMSTLHTPDATIDYGSIVMQGIAEIDGHYSRVKAQMLGTSHTLSNPLVKIDGDSAVAIHRVIAHTRRPAKTLKFDAPPTSWSALITIPAAQPVL